MARQDLREFVRHLEEQGELHEINAEVDPVLEIAAITAMINKQLPAKALLFKNVKGKDIPVLTNLFGSYSRVNLALQTSSLEDLANKFFHDLAEISERTVEDRLKTLLKSSSWLPKVSNSNCRCQEIIRKKDGDLFTLPVLKSWPGDGGHYITLPMIFSRNPVSGEVNCGMYRVQIFDSQTAGIHWGEQAEGAAHFQKWKELGKPMPVAVAIGGDPVMTYAASFPLPKGLNEVAFAGYLRKSPVEMVQCVTNDLQVPGDAEIVIEGFVDPERVCLEGPFGNHTGYYTEKAPVPVMRVTAITCRKYAIYPCTVVGRAPMENCYMAKATERLLLSLLKLEHPTIRNINFPMEGIFHGCAFLSLEPEAEGKGRDLIELLWQKGFLKHARLLIIYNHEVNVSNPSEVYWHAINRVRGDKDILIDGSRIGIDATVKDHRVPVVSDAATLELVGRRWAEYGIK